MLLLRVSPLLMIPACSNGWAILCLSQELFNDKLVLYLWIDLWIDRRVVTFGLTDVTVACDLWIDLCIDQRDATFGLTDVTFGLTDVVTWCDLWTA